MDVSGIVAAGILLVLVVLLVRRGVVRRGVLRPGPGTAGAFYELLSQDKRAAIEVIVGERAAEHDPEDADGNLPDLAGPRLHGDTHAEDSGRRADSRDRD